MPDSKLAEKLGFEIDEGFYRRGKWRIRPATASEVKLWNLCLELSERLAGIEGAATAASKIWGASGSGNFEECQTCGGDHGTFDNFTEELVHEENCEWKALAERLAEKEKKA